MDPVASDIKKFRKINAHNTLISISNPDGSFKNAFKNTIKIADGITRINAITVFAIVTEEKYSLALSYFFFATLIVTYLLCSELSATVAIVI